MTRIFVHNKTLYRFVVEDGQDPAKIAETVLSFFGVSDADPSDISEEMNDLPSGSFSYPAPPWVANIQHD